MLSFNIHNYTVLSKSGKLTVFRHWKDSNEGFHHDLQAKSGSFTTFRHFQTFSQEETMAIVFIPIGFWWNVWETKILYAQEDVYQINCDICHAYYKWLIISESRGAIRGFFIITLLSPIATFCKKQRFSGVLEVF